MGSIWLADLQEYFVGKSEGMESCWELVNSTKQCLDPHKSHSPFFSSYQNPNVFKSQAVILWLHDRWAGSGHASAILTNKTERGSGRGRLLGKWLVLIRLRGLMRHVLPQATNTWGWDAWQCWALLHIGSGTVITELPVLELRVMGPLENH
jgi:hypothetical protein